MTAPPPNPGGYRADWCERCTDSTPHARDTGRCLWCAVELEIVPVGDALPEGWGMQFGDVIIMPRVRSDIAVGRIEIDGTWTLLPEMGPEPRRPIGGTDGLPALLSECCERGWYGLPEGLPGREEDAVSEDKRVELCGDPKCGICYPSWPEPTGGAGQQAAELVRERDVYADPVTLDTEDGRAPNHPDFDAVAFSLGIGRCIHGVPLYRFCTQCREGGGTGDPVAYAHATGAAPAVSASDRGDCATETITQAPSRSDARARVLRVLGERYHEDTLCPRCGGLLEIALDQMCTRCVLVIEEEDAYNRGTAEAHDLLRDELRDALGITRDVVGWNGLINRVRAMAAQDRPSLLRRIVRAVRERVGGDDG